VVLKNVDRLVLLSFTVFFVWMKVERSLFKGWIIMYVGIYCETRWHLSSYVNRERIQLYQEILTLKRQKELISSIFIKFSSRFQIQ